MFPSGTFVTVSLRDGRNMTADIETLNIGLAQKIIFHVKRFFIVWKLSWVNQKERSFCDDALVLKYEKGTTDPIIIFQEDVRAVKCFKQNTPDYRAYAEFLEYFKNKNYLGEEPDVPTINSDYIRSIYKVTPNGFKAADSRAGLGEQHYAIYNKAGKIGYLIFFIRK